MTRLRNPGYKFGEICVYNLIASHLLRFGIGGFSGWWPVHQLPTARADFGPKINPLPMPTAPTQANVTELSRKIPNL